MSVVGGRGAAFRAFTPRIAEFDYVSIPAAPVVFVDDVVNSEFAICESIYPHDPRNLSILDGAFKNVLTNLTGDTLTDLVENILIPL